MRQSVAVFGSLATVYVYQHSFAIDVADLQAQPFLEPKSQRVDRPEIGPVVVRADGRDQPPYLIDREDVREPFLLADTGVSGGSASREELCGSRRT